MKGAERGYNQKHLRQVQMLKLTIWVSTLAVVALTHVDTF